MWITGVRDNVVTAIDTPDDFFGADSIAKEMKLIFDDVHMWAVRPDYNNPHFLAIYEKTDAIANMPFEEMVELINSGQLRREQ